MFNKKELIAGSLAFMLFLLWLISIFADVINISQNQSLPAISDPLIAKVVAWVITGYTIFSLVVLIILTKKGREFAEGLDRRFSIRFAIPGHFYLVLPPVVIGMALALITGFTEWGIWLSCISFPALAIFLLIALK